MEKSTGARYRYPRSLVRIQATRSLNRAPRLKKGLLPYGANCWDERFGADGMLGRDTPAEVVLQPRLRAALERLNPDLTPDTLDLAGEELAKDRGAMSIANANREVYGLLKDGVRVTVPSEDEGDTVEVVRVIDWNDPKRRS